MKTLYIVRHAQAVEKSVHKMDFDRKLTDKGISDSKLMGIEMRQAAINPNMVLSSPAKRALQTAQIMVAALDSSVDNIVCNKDIFNATFKTLLKILFQSPDKISSLMLFGHNPSMKDLANYLGDKIFEKLPKGSVVAIKFNVKKWTDIEKRSGKVTYFQFPKNLLLTGK